MENPTFGPICRTCMRIGQNFHSILEYESVGKLRISEMLMATVPQLDIQPGTDKLPVLICAECLNQLNISYHYQELCIQTDKSLKAMLVHNVDAADVEQQQQKKMEHIDIEIKEIETLMPKEFATDPLVYNTFPLHSNSIKIETETECEELLNSGDDKNDVLKAITNEKATTAIEVVSNDVATITSCDLNEMSVPERPDDCYRIERHFPCLVCHKKFDSSFLLRRHSLVHSLKRPYECDICKYRFNTENQLKRHKATHSNAESAKTEAPPDGYKCPDCPRRFEKSKSLSAHFRSHRRAFALNSNLKNLEKHSDLDKFECVHCDKAFSNNPSLKQHMNTHTGEKPHLCPQCGKAFKQLSCLRQHQLRHSNEKRYHCQECSSKFFCSSDLSKHMSVHRTTNPHICDICGSSFSRSYTLNNHKQIHSGERPYKCVECNMSFVFIGRMRRHMRTHTGQKPYQCKYCDRAYSASGDLNKHLRSHVGENTYMCDECPKAFKYIKELQLHKMQHFKEKQLELETPTAAVSSAIATNELSTITKTKEGKTTDSIGVVN